MKLLNIQKHQLNLKISENVLAQRKKNWVKPALAVKSGVLKKYANQVKTAADGCVTDED